MKHVKFIPNNRHFDRMCSFSERVTRKQLQDVLLDTQPNGGQWRWQHVGVGVYVLDFVYKVRKP